MGKIKEYFENLVKNGIIPKEPGNYDAATMQIYIDHLEAETTPCVKGWKGRWNG